MLNPVEIVPELKPTRMIFRTWWPLAFSWLLMAVEIPALTAVIARLPDAKMNLAAYGGVVYPLSLIIEAPIIMLLAASVALNKDWPTYLKLRKFMMAAGATLTGLHILLAFTPAFTFLVRNILHVPAEIVEPARMGFRIMVPWTWSIAYRRFNQGVMIRYGHSDAVGAGTIVRLTADGVMLFAGAMMGSLSGIVVATAAQAVGVICEAVYAGLRVRPVLRLDVKTARVADALTWKGFYRFYIPLALTSLINLIWQPIGSAAISRMSLPLTSLAVWPVVTGLSFILRSPGVAFNEVVVAMLDRAGTRRALHRFGLGLALGTTLLQLIMLATPLAGWWFTKVSGLPADLIEISKVGFWLALPMPFLAAMQSWYQGAILYGRNTRGIPESVGIFLGTVLLLLVAGVAWGKAPGLYIGLVALDTAMLLQTVWLGWRSRGVLKQMRL